MPHLRLNRLCVALLLALVATLTSGSLAFAQPKPNIVILFADDAGYSDFGFMNQITGQTTEFKTPNLDALAQQSAVFSTAYVTSSVCSASRAGLLTGRYQQRMGIDYLVGDANDPINGIPTSEVLLSEALKTQGYATGMVGKWHIGPESAKQPQNQGFDEFYGIIEGGRPHFGTTGVPVQRNGATVPWTTESSFNNTPNDPVLGRQITDAFGDEAAKFIANHANQTDPFFLYMPFTAPHSPLDKAKASDLAQFDSTTLTGFRKNVAALTFAMDRAVGNVMARLNDPNNDGDTSDSVADNTIIVFSNDNGGAPPTDPATGGSVVQSNAPLRQYKGTSWEGGIRVPMIVHAPGLDPGLVSQTVSTLDLFPTLLTAAGGTPAANIDGKDLSPLLFDGDTAVVHDKLFWRGGINTFAIRKGEWKVVKGVGNAYVQLYKLNSTISGPGLTGEEGGKEMTNANPTKLRELINDYVDWEVTLRKSDATTHITYFNRFDAFRFRTDLSTSLNWRDSGVWLNDAAPGAGVTMNQEDLYANAVLVFQPRNDASYTTNNNMGRSSGLSYFNIDSNGSLSPAGLIEFMLNELRFNGQFNGATTRTGTLTGWPLMFVKNLNGEGPKMVLDSTANVANNFTFNVNMDVVLHDDLLITGNSTQPYAIGGQIRDFTTPRTITKTGTSSIMFSGNNTYSGDTIVNQGGLRIDGASAALANTSSVQIGAQGAVTLASGRIRTPTLQIAAGGAFNFIGGVLEAAQVTGSLTNNGGTFKPGLSTASVGISGNYNQIAGALAVEIGGVAAGTQYDKLIVANSAILNGALQVSLINAGGGMFTPAIGNSFEIISAGVDVTGAFTSLSAPTLPAGRRWAIQYNPKSVTLQVVSSLTADFDGNNVINSMDLNVWRSSLGVNALGDADGDGDTDGFDFLSWQRQDGLRLFPASGALHAVPEPDAVGMTLAAGAAVATCMTSGWWRKRTASCGAACGIRQRFQ